MRWSASEVFLTNLVGEYCFLQDSQFTAFVQRSLADNSCAYRELKSKHFLLDSDSKLPIELLATKYRTKKAFMEGFTKLHLFIVTLRCDHSCIYCAASSVPADQCGYDMDQETAKRAVDLMFCCPSKAFKVEFQGGEPLLNFDIVRFIYEYSENINAGDRQIDYVVCTNLASLDKEKLDFLKQHSIFVSTSLDGPQFIHNANRRYNRGSSYDIAVERIKTVMAELGQDRISALMTATDLSLNYPREIIDEYVKIGLGAIFLRSIRPYGRSQGQQSQYSISKFIDFYRRALAYIIELNRQGIHMVEGFAQVLLGKILTPFATGFVDLQSPAGAGISFVAYNYDGDIYASDEARMLAKMRDRTFRMGNLYSDSYDDIFGGSTIRAIVDNSCVEVLPGCSECTFQVYCGADPIHNYTTQGDIIGHMPTSDFCQKNKAIIRLLFEYLRNGDDFIRDLFLSWVSPHSPKGRC
jgi:His-Xaa-Ser system radical SAM maturase HxsB